MTIDQKLTLNNSTSLANDPIDETLQITVSLSCTVDANCPTGQICQGGICVTPFNWIQIGILAILGIAVVLVAAGVVTTKD